MTAKKSTKAEEKMEQQTLMEPVTATEQLPAELNETNAFLEKQAAEQQEEITSLPRLKVAQKGENAGKLVSEEVGEAWDTMSMVLLRSDRSRILWPEEYSKDNDPLCKSHDGITPVPASEMEDCPDYSTMAEKCEDCQYSKWASIDGKRVPPACNDVIDMMLIDNESLIPMLYSVHSTSFSTTQKELLKPLRLRQMSLTAKRSKAGLPPAHSSMYVFDLSTSLRESPAGDSYVPKYNNIRQLEDDDAEMMVSIAMQMQDYDMHYTMPKEEGEGGGGDKGEDF